MALERGDAPEEGKGLGVTEVVLRLE